MSRNISEVIAEVQPQLIEPFQEMVALYHREPDRIKAIEDLDRRLETLLIESGLNEHGCCFSYAIIRGAVMLRVIEIPNE